VRTRAPRTAGRHDLNADGRTNAVFASALPESRTLWSIFAGVGESSAPAGDALEVVNQRISDLVTASMLRGELALASETVEKMTRELRECRYAPST